MGAGNASGHGLSEITWGIPPTHPQWEATFMALDKRVGA